MPVKTQIACLFFLLTCLVQIGCKAQNQSNYNFDIEEITTGKPRGWLYSVSGADTQNTYIIQIDSLVKQHGKYSLSLSKGDSKAAFGATNYNIPKTFVGKNITLKGYIKTDSVNTGYAGLWLRIDGKGKYIAFDNMGNRGIKGTTGWKEYTIELPYDQDKATSINAGALLVGDGKIWVDNISIYIDDKPIDQADEYAHPLTAIEKDSVFNKSSKIDTIITDKKQVEYLTLTGQLWGFLKYHHPAIAKGYYNWDAELFRILPSVQHAKGNAEISAIFEKWVDKLGKPPVCPNCEPLQKIQNIKLKPDYGSLFNNKVFSNALMSKLKYILANRNTGTNYYIGLASNAKNPDFSNEDAYIQFEYPDAGYRMLSLFRYWNMIQYFFPYRHLIGEDWNKVLPEFIAKFASVRDNGGYDLVTLELIARIHDTHAGVWSNRAGLTTYRGNFYAPVRTKFIENKLTVTGYYQAYQNIRSKLKPGDVITKINGVAVDELKKKYLPLTAASNYETQLRDMPGYNLLRGNKPKFIFETNKGVMVPVTGINGRDMDFKPDDPALTKPGYYLLNDSIAYLLPSKYKNAELPAIKSLFANTKGMIIDMRCYPSDFMPFIFGAYIKSTVSSFVKFTVGNPSYPGLFTMNQPLSNGGLEGFYYPGRVVVIVNEDTQSQAEYTTMAFQSSPNVTVIGSTTAGADGNVSAIYLPGNIYTMISGIGVYYPDGTETQRKGVKIDIRVKPTVKGIREGRDELLERAQKILSIN